MGTLNGKEKTCPKYGQHYVIMLVSSVLEYVFKFYVIKHNSGFKLRPMLPYHEINYPSNN